MNNLRGVRDVVRSRVVHIQKPIDERDDNLAITTDSKETNLWILSSVARDDERRTKINLEIALINHSNGAIF